MGTAVGDSVGTEASVGEMSVAGGGGVAVKTAAVGDCGEQEIRRKKREERRMREVRLGGMEGILTELPANDVPRINAKTSRRVPRTGGSSVPDGTYQ